MEKSGTPLSTPLDIHVDDKSNMYVECYICMKTPTDPIATLCGHIFCWPCIYVWLQNGSKPCPICRIVLAKEMSILALYGFGTSAKPTNNTFSENEATTSTNIIPPRPPNPAWFVYPDLHRVMSETNIGGSKQDTLKIIFDATYLQFRQLHKEIDLKNNLIRNRNQLERRISDLTQEIEYNTMQHRDEINQLNQALVKLQLQLAQANDQKAQANE